MPILCEAGIQITEIAYVTLLQWRTKPKKGLGPLYRACWDAHTKAQIVLLKPEMIVVLGKAAGRFLESFMKADTRIRIVRRGIGDSHVPPEGKKAMTRIISELQSH
jgi:uracil-DNA glycosylase